MPLQVDEAIKAIELLLHNSICNPTYARGQKIEIHFILTLSRTHARTHRHKRQNLKITIHAQYRLATWLFSLKRD